MIRIDRSKFVVGFAAVILSVLGGCGSNDSDDSADSGSSTAQPEQQATEEAAPAAEPTTEVVSCKIEEGLPVAEVKVTNSLDVSGVFGVGVQFLSGSTVLGDGFEVTASLEPGQDETIRMGNMQGDAEAVDECKVTEASLSE